MAKQTYSQTMSKEMRHIMDHAQVLVDATSGELDDRIKEAREALNERLAVAKSKYGDIEDRVMDKVRDADEFVHAKPYYAIGGTFLVGLVMGWFMSRK